MRQKDYYEAYLDDYDKIIVYISKLSYDGSSNLFYLRDDVGNLIDLHIQSVETTPNNYNKYTLLLTSNIVMGNEYEVVHEHARATILQYSGIVKTAQFDDTYDYDGNDLGVTYTSKCSTFALWAPTAFRVKLEVLKNGRIHTYEMRRTFKGVFRYCIEGDLEHATYMYHVRVNGQWKETIDPYGVASTENTKRSAIIDLDKLHVRDYELPTIHSACDAIIYEASVRDFTIQNHCGVEHPGTFVGFFEENEETKTKLTGFSYLKSLGITHLQLMPVTDFGSVDEIYPEKHYNWGYDPVQYRVLEGSYSVDPFHPYDRMLSFISLVEHCHKEGIRVNLDVVFNHVYDKDTSSFENVVPSYYFQMNEQGDFSNGTFCGNDVDSTRKMCSRYIVDTCSFLVRTYHIDGLRFDLMGVLDIDTMNRVYDTCHAMNPNFMLYGEGWDMPSFLDGRRRASMYNQAQMPHIGHFSDRFRDVVKGRTSSNEASIKGYCTGDYNLMDIMKNCLSASCTGLGMNAMFSNPINAINYVECHDNMSAWDKLKECCVEDSKEVRIKRQIMLNGACLLAQGVPFLHCGQEFARTKHGLPNTYESSDSINKIDYDRRNQYNEIVQTTKQLIAIRKKYACLRYATKEEVEQYVRFEDIDRKALVYKIQDSNDDMLIIFNPSQDCFSYHLPYEYTCIFNDGNCEEIKMQKIAIHPFSMMILYHAMS